MKSPHTTYSAAFHWLNPACIRPLCLATALASCSLQARAQAQTDPATVERLQRQLQQLQEEVNQLKSAQTNAPPSTPAPRAPATEEDELMREDLLKSGFSLGKGLSIGFYGEAKYRFPEEGADEFDPHRFVLTPSYQMADWLVFNSELEFEHGGIDERTDGDRSRFDGEIELEQFYADILINRYFNIRSLGIDLVPVGRINKYHEPTLFYSTERPELYREIIPSTWFEPSVGVFGDIVEGWDYQLMLSTGLEDAISSSPGTAGIRSDSGFRDARPRLRDADESDLALSGRVHYKGVPGMDASTSFYVTQVTGFDDDRTSAALWDIEALYRVPGTGLELRADFAHWWLSDPGALVANNNADPTDDLGERLYGYYFEAAYHYWPEAWKKGRGREMELVPFIRYSDIVTQSQLEPGSESRDDGTTNKDFVTLGAAYFLNRHFVMKADYRWNLNGSSASAANGASQDYFQIGAGIFF